MKKLNGRSRLTESNIIAIRYHWDNKTMSVREMALLFEVGQETIRKVGRRESWVWVKDTSRGLL